MKRAIELSTGGIGYVNPNPLVGAVIVKGGRIIGEGYHKAYGGYHAEIEAFRNAVEDISGATMYVTLEPCSHYGKTPPCAVEIVNRGIKRVVIGMVDPNPKVCGTGIKILQENGIDVVTGVLEEDVRVLNEIFVKYITKNRPFCIMKTAMTLDGKIATYTGDSRWISNERSREYVHQLRHRVSGIMVGIGTVLNDDPLLTTRLTEKEGKDAIRIIVDTNLRIPLNTKIVKTSSNVKTIIAASKVDKEKVTSLKDMGIEVLKIPMKNKLVDLDILMDELGNRGIDSVLLEGGGTLNFSALSSGIVDKVMAFISPKIIGGKDAKTPVEGKGFEFIRNGVQLKDTNISNFDGDILVEGYVKVG